MSSHRLPNTSTFALALAALLTPVGASAAGKLAFKTASLDFGANALGEVKTKVATLKNGTTTDIELNAAALAENPGGYVIASTTCGATLAAGQSCKYTLRYTAKTLQLAAARLELTTLDPAFPLVKLPLQANRYPALNDTGITGCTNADTNGLTCPVPDFPGQDAQFGRDKIRNLKINGSAGFNFTKLDAKGKTLPASAKNWNCVRDNLTGLVWEKKPKGDGYTGNQGLHDADDTYTWCSTDVGNDGGNPGYDNEGNTCFRYVNGRPASYCNTEAYVNRVNAAGWCGFKDWRLPDRFELLGLADLSKYVFTSGLPIDTFYFPDTRNDPYWSSSPYASDDNYAWYVEFSGGNFGFGLRYFRYNAVRLVRGSGQ